MGIIGSICAILIVIVIVLVMFPVLPDIFNNLEKHFGCEEEQNSKDSNDS
jgi:uncharacterized membrane protein